MKKQLIFWIINALVISMVCFTGCKEDDDDMSGKTEKTYTLDPLSNSGVSGTVTFRKQNTQTTLIIVQLSGTQSGNSHPAHIHANNASVGGPIMLDFNPVDGTTGRSETMVTKLNDGTAITYEQLIAFDGHVNVHQRATELQIMIAQGNIGSNATGSTGGDSADGGY